MLALGTVAPEFNLPEPATGKTVSINDFSSAPALVVAFLSNHCPYVKHLQKGLASLAADYAGRGLVFVGINANDIQRYPADAPDKMVTEARNAGWKFPYLFDSTQTVAKHYRAACTPDLFLFDANRKLVYRGQFDDSRPGNGKPVTGDDLRKAIDAVLKGEAPPSRQIPSLGCSIKWKPGNEPDYFK
jgi:thiol-disulfide isomerase/thioredoxin